MYTPLPTFAQLYSTKMLQFVCIICQLGSLWWLLVRSIQMLRELCSHHQTEGSAEIYNFSFLLKMPDHSLGSTVYFHWADGPDRWGPVGERVPLTLDAGVVCVERLADADDVQAGLVGQLGQEL